MSIEEILKTIKKTKSVSEFSGKIDKFDIGFDISPNEFLKYAENDLKSKVEHRNVNALSNAKRAIDCQIEGLLKLFGFYKIAKRKFWGFPKKLEPRLCNS